MSGRALPAALARWAIPGIGLLAFLIYAVLLQVAPGVYDKLLRVVMKVPAIHPFTDWEWIPAAVRCFSDGVDVYVSNPCYKPDPSLNWNYPPLWLRLTFLKYGEGWVGPTVAVAVVLFFASLAAIRRPADSRTFVMGALALLSSATVLAIERANVDLLIFLLVVAALLLARLSLPFRLLGYAVLLFAGLLKLYPLVALVIVLRERFAVLCGVGLVCVAVVAAMVVRFHSELALMAASLPAPSIFTLQFGWAELPAGLGVAAAVLRDYLAGSDPAGAQAIASLVERVMRPILLAVSLGGAYLFWRSGRLQTGLDRLDPDTRRFFIVGAALVGGCFFAGQSVIYRGIFLFLTLPGLAWFRVDGGRLANWGAWMERAIVFVLWVPAIESIVFLLHLAIRPQYQASPLANFPGLRVGGLLWLADEFAWWWIATTFLAVLLTFAVQSAGRWQARAAT